MPEPSLPEARLQLSFDGPERPGRKILAAVDRHDGRAPSAPDEDVGALLPHLLATEPPQEPEEVLRSHHASIGTDHHRV